MIFSKKYPYIPQVDEMDCGIACQDLLTGKMPFFEICPWQVLGYGQNGDF